MYGKLERTRAKIVAYFKRRPGNHETPQTGTAVLHPPLEQANIPFPIQPNCRTRYWQVIGLVAYQG
jgi:hypothetical protein